jgi:hypothetical protein
MSESEAKPLEPHVYALRRVGNVLLVYFALHLLSVLADVLLAQSHSFTLDVMSLVLGLLLRRGSLGAARFTTFVYALSVAFAAGAVVILALVVALHLGPHVPLSLGWGSLLVCCWLGFWYVAELAMFVWILRELLDPAVEEALAAARRGSTRSMLFWGGGVGLAFAALLLPFAMLLGHFQAQFQPLVDAAVEKKLGPGWQVNISAFMKGPQHWKAHVVARKGKEVRELDLSDDPADQ